MSFIITGLPRSQTFWASKLFRSNGYSCIHDDLSMMTSKYLIAGKPMHHEMLFSKMINGDFGISDSCIPLFKEYYDMFARFPKVVITRDVEDVFSSLVKLGLKVSFNSLLFMKNALNSFATLPNTLIKQFPLNQFDADQIFEFCTGKTNLKFRSKHYSIDQKELNKIRRLTWKLS